LSFFFSSECLSFGYWSTDQSPASIAALKCSKIVNIVITIQQPMTVVEHQ